MSIKIKNDRWLPGLQVLDSAISNNANIRTISSILSYLPPEALNKIRKGESTPLESAIRKKRCDVVEALLEHGANPNLTQSTGLSPLARAAFDGRVRIVAALLRAGARPDFCSESRTKTPLPCAIRKGNSLVVEQLLRAGVNPDELVGGSTALHEAVNAGRWQCVTVLSRAMKNLNQTDRYGETALQRAILLNDIRSVQILLEAGARVDVLADRKPLLLLAAQRGNERIVRLLLAHGANPNVQDGRGETPLHAAARTDHVATLKMLLRHGANPLLTNSQGKAAHEIAQEACQRKALEFLRGKLSHALNYHLIETAQLPEVIARVVISYALPPRSSAPLNVPHPVREEEKSRSTD